MAWLDNICRKLETVLLDVDKCGTQNHIRKADGHKAGVASNSPSSNVGHEMLSSESSCSPELTAAEDKPEEVTESISSDSIDMRQDRHCPAPPSSDSPSNSPSDIKFDILKHEHSGERIEGNGMKDTSSDPILASEELCSRAPLLEEYANCNQIAAISHFRTELTPLQDTDRGCDNSWINDVFCSYTFSGGDPSVPPYKQRLQVDRFASQNRSSYTDGHKVGVMSTSRSFDVGLYMLSPEASGLPALAVVKDKPEQVAESDFSDPVDMRQDCPALPSSKSPESGSDKKIDIVENENSDERIEGNGIKDTLSHNMLAAEELCSTAPSLEENIDFNQTAATSLCLMELTLSQDTDRGCKYSRITNVSSSLTFSCGDPSVLPCKESREEVGINLHRSMVAAESQFTESFHESFGTEVACNGSTVVCSPGYSFGDSNQLPPATAVPAAIDEGNMAKMRPSGSNSVMTSIGNQCDFRNNEDELDAASLDTIELYDVTNGEDNSDFEDSLLYAVRHRTRKLRSFKRKILDALGSKRGLEKDYERLAIWFGDASMGSDLSTPKLPYNSKAVTAVDCKTLQLPLTSEEDSEWELVDKPHIH